LLRRCVRTPVTGLCDGHFGGGSPAQTGEAFEAGKPRRRGVKQHGLRTASQTRILGKQKPTAGVPWGGFSHSHGDRAALPAGCKGFESPSSLPPPSRREPPLGFPARPPSLDLFVSLSLPIYNLSRADMGRPPHHTLLNARGPSLSAQACLFLGVVRPNRAPQAAMSPRPDAIEARVGGPTPSPLSRWAQQGAGPGRACRTFGEGRCPVAGSIENRGRRAPFAKEFFLRR